MGLQELYKGTKIIETLQNYAISESTNFTEEECLNNDDFYFNTDENFWECIIKNPEKYWYKNIELYDFVVSDWVARIPGLYWSPSSKLMRHILPKDIIYKSKKWTEFHPIGKSKKVMGGVGTIMLPPTDEGKILLSVTSSCNASTGIPVLIFPEVFEQLNIKQGDCLIIRGAKWLPMDKHWSSNFMSSDLPRGYLIIDSVDKIIIREKNCPVAYHPFSLMEYERDDSQFYDFVYLTADSSVENVDKKIETFFDEYAKKEGRNGEYLINPNVVKPIFQCRYLSPSELNKESEKANLNLLYERIKKTYFKGHYLDDLIIKIPQYYNNSTSIRTLAKNIGISPAWIEDGSAVNMSAQLINLCVKKGLTENLIDRVTSEYKQIFI